MKVVKLNAKVRTEFSKGATNKLRSSGNVPGVLYHHGEPNVHFSIDEVSLLPLIYTPDTHLLEVTFSDGQTRTAVVKEFQFNPVTDKCDHLDLQGMSANEKITIDVPVITTGTSIGVVGGGMLQINYHTLHVKCLPKDMPEHISIDITDLELGHAIHVGDIKVPNAEITNDSRLAVVSVVHRKVEVAAPAGAAVAAEPEISSAKGKKEEDKKA